MTKVVIYARVSSEMQADDEIPILGQLQECESYAKSKGWEIAKVYKDEGFTGRNTDRPGFNQMMLDAKKKPAPFEKIIVWKGSRIARNTEDRLAFHSLLGRKGIDVITIKEPEFDGPTKILMLPIMAAIDEYTSYLIGEDTLRGMKTLARQGYSAGGRPPKGYRTHREPAGLKKNGEPRFHVRWEPDPEWRDNALKVFQMVSEGRSCMDIIKETGIAKNRSSLPTYFRNRTFIGERVFNVHRGKTTGHEVEVPLDDPEVVRVPDAHEGIIPHDLFDHVQEILQKRRPQPGQVRAANHNFVLSGLLWCGTHDCTIIGHGNRERGYYVCTTLRHQGRKGTDCPTYKKQPLENFIIDILKERVFSRERIYKAVKYLIDAASNENEHLVESLAELKGKIVKLKREVDNVNESMFKSGIFPESTLKIVSTKENEIRQIEKRMADLKEAGQSQFGNLKLDNRLIDDIRIHALAALDNESPEERRIFLRTYIEQIKITGKTIDVKFNFRNPDSSQETAEGVGFEPTTPLSQGKRLAGARTRPLCDPSSTPIQPHNYRFLTRCPIFADQAQGRRPNRTASGLKIVIKKL